MRDIVGREERSPFFIEHGIIEREARIAEVPSVSARRRRIRGESYKCNVNTRVVDTVEEEEGSSDSQSED